MLNLPEDIDKLVQYCKEQIRKYDKWLVQQTREQKELEYTKYAKYSIRFPMPAKALSEIDLINRTINYYGKWFVDVVNQNRREQTQQ